MAIILRVSDSVSAEIIRRDDGTYSYRYVYDTDDIRHGFASERAAYDHARGLEVCAVCGQAYGTVDAVTGDGDPCKVCRPCKDYSEGLV
jgi:hypothetical protein